MHCKGRWCYGFFNNSMRHVDRIPHITTGGCLEFSNVIIYIFLGHNSTSIGPKWHWTIFCKFVSNRYNDYTYVYINVSGQKTNIYIYIMSKRKIDVEIRPHRKCKRACLSGGTNTVSFSWGGRGGPFFWQVKCMVRSQNIVIYSIFDPRQPPPIFCVTTLWQRLWQTKCRF